MIELTATEAKRYALFDAHGYPDYVATGSNDFERMIKLNHAVFLKDKNPLIAQYVLDLIDQYFESNELKYIQNDPGLLDFFYLVTRILISEKLEKITDLETAEQPHVLALAAIFEFEQNDFNISRYEKTD